MIRKLFGWALVAFVFFFVAYRPTRAAVLARALGGAIGNIANGLGDFASQLVR